MERHNPRTPSRQSLHFVRGPFRVSLNRSSTPLDRPREQNLLVDVIGGRDLPGRSAFGQVRVQGQLDLRGFQGFGELINDGMLYPGVLIVESVAPPFYLQVNTTRLAALQPWRREYTLESVLTAIYRRVCRNTSMVL
jgi:hypothetical protein